MYYGPITREQHNSIIALNESWVRQHGYCYLVYWIPNHPIHGIRHNWMSCGEVVEA